MAEVGSAYVTIIPSARGFSKQLSGQIEPPAEAAGRSAGRRSGLGLVAGLGAAGVGVGVAALFKGSITAASDFTETLSKTGVVFGDQAGQVVAWSKDSASSFGLSQQAALAATSQYGDMFQQLGFTGKAAAGASQGLVQMAGDLGSFHNVDPSDVLDRIGGALRGEYDSLQQLIPNINAARVEQQALATTHKKSAKDLTAAEKATAVLAIVQKDGARASGDFARTSGGLANQQRILSAQFQDVQAAVGARLVPALAAAAAFITGTLIPAGTRISGFLQDNATTIGVVAGIITALFVPALIRWGVQSTIAAAKSAAAWLTTQLGAWKATAAHVVAFASMVGGWVAMAARAVISAVVVASQWTLIGLRAAAGAAMSALSVVTVVAGWVFMGVQSLIQAARMAAAWFIALGPIGWAIAAIAVVVVLVIKYWSQIRAATVAIWNAIVAALRGAWNFLVRIVAVGVNAARAVVTTVFSATRAAVVTIWQSIVGALRAAWASLVTVVASGVNAARSVVTAVFNAIKSVIALYLRAWLTIITTYWGLITGVVRGAVGAVKGAITGLANIGQTIGSYFGAAVRAVSSAVGNLLTVVAGVPGRITGALGDLGGLLVGAGEDMIRGLISGIGNMAGAAKDAAINVAKSAVSGMTGFLRINSPSLVFAEIGSSVGEGLILGMDRHGAKVAAASGRMATAAQFEAPTDARRAPRAAPTGLSSATGGGGTYAPQVTINAAPSVPTEQQMIAALDRIAILHGVS